MTSTEKTSIFNIGQTSFMPAEAQKAFTAMAEIQGEAFKAMLNYQIETLAFLKQRFEKDLKLVDQLAASAEHGDAYDVCVDFYREAFSDYSNEASKLARLESRVASETAKKLRKESRDFAEDIAAQTAA